MAKEVKELRNREVDPNNNAQVVNTFEEAQQLKKQRLAQQTQGKAQDVSPVTETAKQVHTFEEAQAMQGQSINKLKN